MTMTDPNATISSASLRKIDTGVSVPIYALALLCSALSCAIPSKAWAEGTILVEVYGSGSCQTLSITGSGWGKKTNHIDITAVGLPGVPGTATIAPSVPTSGGYFSVNVPFT
jgi:hypothetical protein